MTNVILATITGYCACQICCGPRAQHLTASGRNPTPTHTIAAPRNILFGSHIIVAGRRYTVEDRTHPRYDGRFDIYFKSHAEARRFGIRTNQVTVITK